MWKLWILGFVFILINTFANVKPSSLISRRRVNRRTENFVEIVRKTGYFAEERFVTTEDGYVLCLHRIFGGPKSPPAPKKPLILLLHGMLASSDVWIMRGPKKDLVYFLADEGFDVWMLNVRGNTYSRRHLRISPKSPEFWQFSWHENGIYDMPAAIDYMLALTGLSKLTLIGYSMGATSSYVMLSLRPEYNEKINLLVSLAPVAFFTRIFRGPLTLALPLWKELRPSLKRRGVNEILPHKEGFPQIASDVCGRPGVNRLCTDSIYLISGSADRKPFDDSVTPFLLEHFPAGSSIDTLDHYLQNLEKASFREFDFGVAGNYARYGSPIPPEYALDKVTAPVVLFYAPSDMYVRPPDVEALQKKLSNVVGLKIIRNQRFNHLDYIISKESKELVYNDVIALVKKYGTKGNRYFL